jgi:hypothetical protein
MGEGDGRAFPGSSFIEEEVDVQGPGAVAIRGPLSTQFSLDFQGFNQEFVRIFITNYCQAKV